MPQFNPSSHGICQVAIAPIRAAASDESEIVTQLLFGDYVRLIEIGNPWIKVQFEADDYEGWMDHKQLYYIDEEEYIKGVKLTHEVVKTGMVRIEGPIGMQHITFGSNLPFLSGDDFKIGSFDCKLLEPLPPFNETLTTTAMRFLNTPYLWGGKGIFGIDCSGFVQLVAKAHGYFLPRDASQQVAMGDTVTFENRKAGDLMYFINKKGHVHHLGILLNETEIIHASGHVRIDTYTSEGLFRKDMDKITHPFHSIKRL